MAAVKAGKGALIGAIAALALGLGLLAPVMYEGRFEALSGWLFGPEWIERPARIVELSPSNGRFTLRYRYQFEGDSYESQRIAPDWLLEGFEAQWHKARQEEFSHAMLHSRPVPAHVNTENPEQAMLFRPAGLPAMAVSAGLGALMIVLSAGLFLRWCGLSKQLR